MLLIAYSELSKRQWHTYRLLNSSLLKEIDFILVKLWDKHSLESPEIILGIIFRLGLPKTFKQIKANLSQKLSEEVRTEILEAIEEFGDIVTNPYSGMQSQA
jgi:hypothetical protein